jgi:hypothetical protein
VARKRRLITDCVVDTDRLAVFKDCIETYGMENRAPGSEWPWNVLAKSTIAFSCGLLAFRRNAEEHNHDAEEFALCSRLAAEVCRTMDGRDFGMGSNSGDPFRPYYAVANAGSKVPRRVTEKKIREVFGGTIYPPTKIVIEPLAEKGEWWKQVVEDGSGDEGYLGPWRVMIRWFRDQESLHGPVFVMIGDDPLDEDLTTGNGGCVFPRMAIALTDSGSLVGIGGWCVHA